MTERLPENEEDVLIAFTRKGLKGNVYRCVGMAWTVTTAEIHLMSGKLRYLYRCGHKDTPDYCALREYEILTREEAEEALRRGENGKR